MGLDRRFFPAQERVGHQGTSYYILIEARQSACGAFPQHSGQSELLHWEDNEFLQSRTVTIWKCTLKLSSFRPTIRRQPASKSLSQNLHRH